MKKYIIALTSVALFSTIISAVATPCPTSAGFATAQYTGEFVIKGVYFYKAPSGGQIVVMPPSQSGTPSKQASRIYLSQTTTSWTANTVNGVCAYQPGGTTRFSHLNNGGYIVWLPQNLASSPNFLEKLNTKN